MSQPLESVTKVPPLESEVDVLIIGAGPAGLMAALWMSRCGIKTLVVDKREAHVRAGQADGIQCRTLEIFDSFDIVDKVWKESCHMAKMCMWNPGDDGLIRRASRMSNTIPGISRFSNGVLLAQHRIEEIFLDSLEKCNKIEIQRGMMPIDIKHDCSKAEDQNLYPITVNTRPVGKVASLCSSTPNGVGSCYAQNKEQERDREKIIKAKYAIGCDGAHSWTRAQLGFLMEGEQTEYIWGVLDIIPLTDFPDIRSRCAIHSADCGTIMLIPREDRLVRIYCQLSAVTSGSDGRFDRSQITLDTILKAAQKILRPYKLEYKYRDWWTVYQIGQRVGNHFSANERIFLAGDAIHTHSPKAGQGMNVSMQDSYNLGWKLALVIKGIAKRSILKTYELERRAIAQELIAFDQMFSKLFSTRPTQDVSDKVGVLMADFERAFVKQQLFSAGFAVGYGPSVLIAKEHSILHLEVGNGVGINGQTQKLSQQHLATNIPLGKRFPSFKVVNHCDARSWHFAQWLKADGLFHIVLFAGDVSKPTHMQRVQEFALEMAARSTSMPLQNNFKSISNGETHNQVPIADILTIHSAPRQQVEFLDFPELLRPFDEELGYDYNRIFVDGQSYYEGSGNAYEGYGVGKERGCVVVVRPDQHVAWIGELENVEGLEAYFSGFLVGA